MHEHFRIPTSSQSVGKLEYVECLMTHSDKEKKNGVKMLPDILLAENPPSKSSIIFHETSCSDDHMEDLNFLQACAIESVANANPHKNIYVLFASPRVDISNGSYALMTLLDSFHNVYLRNNDIWEYAKETPAQQFMTDGLIFDSADIKSQLQNFLGFLSLWRWEATLLDLSVITLRSFENNTNFAGVFKKASGEALLGNQVLSLDHHFAEECLNDFLNHFEPDFVLHNGGWVVTRMVKDLWRVRKLEDKLVNKSGFTVFPKLAFYPLDENRDPFIYSFFDKSEVSGSYAVYLSTKHSIMLQGIGRNLFKEIALENCPKVSSLAYH